MIRVSAGRLATMSDEGLDALYDALILVGNTCENSAPFIATRHAVMAETDRREQQEARIDALLTDSDDDRFDQGYEPYPKEDDAQWGYAR